MDAEEILKRFQKHMGYTDEDMALFKSDPNKVKMVTETPEFVKCRVIAEVIESKGCHARHLVGDRFVMTPSGQLITENVPKRICLSALAAVGGVIPAVYERLVSKSDPEFKRSQVVQCGDIGLENGGWGKILMKIFLEKIP
jgi:uncharacterized repeat protein (TIGR04076 family)